MKRYIIRWRTIAPIALLGLAACGGDDGPAGPGETDPVITVTGVEDGGSYTGAVTLGISVAPAGASYTATLNGEPVWSGHTVTRPAAYSLVVEARNGLASTTATYDFALVEAGEDLGSVLTVRVIDLGDNDAGGGGDAILLTDSSAAGRVHALVDAGPSGPGGADEAYVAGRLTALGVDSLEAVLLTHAHTDHFLGLDEVLSTTTVERFFYNGQQRSYAPYTDLIALARSSAGSVVVPSVLEVVDLNTTVLTVLPPLGTYLPVYGGGSAGESSAYNEGSLGALVERGTFDLFLTGDGEVEANRRWRTDYGDMTAGVEALKVGHHGANDAIFDNGFDGASSWLDHTDPETMLISANGSSHPRHNALTKILGRTNTRTYCTPVHGDIVIRVTGAGAYGVTPQRNAEMDCVPGTDATS
jgi:beta-lactamase superfamily II metal-dependent hydrolase